MSVETDRASLQTWLANPPDSTTVPSFVAGPGIDRLELRFDIDELRRAHRHAVQTIGQGGDFVEQGFEMISLTRRPGIDAESANDRSGRYWQRDDTYEERAFENEVDEADFSELVPGAVGTYFEVVHRQLSARFAVGRMRLMSKALYNCNSWHRDPEPRVHIPIVADPGSLFVVNHHCTHLPADGSVYFTDTRGYHMAMNGGLDSRVHLVAAIAGTA